VLRAKFRRYIDNLPVRESGGLSEQAARGAGQYATKNKNGKRYPHHTPIHIWNVNS
jgi:hypothetical protein